MSAVQGDMDIEELNGQANQIISPENGSLSQCTNDSTNSNQHPAPISTEIAALVVWYGKDDPENPQNWHRIRKWKITFMLGIMTWVATFASSVFSTAIRATSEEYGVSTETMTLGVSLYVLGFSFGPIIWGPLSELYGRRVPLFIGYTLFAVFQIPVAVAQNIETILILRFVGGICGAAPLAVVAGTLADIWNPVDRGVAICVFAAATFFGPATGPILGGFITQSYLGWRWTAYITLIIAISVGLPGFFVVPETFSPVLLQRRARKIRLETKNWAIHSTADETPINFGEFVTKYLFRPIRMLALEPILIMLTIYMSLVYGILYLFFEAYPISFQEERGWNQGVGALPFIGLTIGVFGGCGITAYITKTRLARKFAETGQIIPEERLPPMIIGAFLLPIGLLWFAWTSNPNIIWVPQVLSSAPIGAGIVMIFMQGLNYIVDVFKLHANSAVSANVFIRSSIGAAFPMFASAMYRRLGVRWATTLLGILTTVMIPIPILLFLYGEKIRRMSHYSSNI